MQRVKTRAAAPAAPSAGTAAPAGAGGGAVAWQPPGVRRRLQLALAFLWLLDGVLQLQPGMFSPAFSQMLAAAGPGNPGPVAAPIGWAARIIASDPGGVNAAFAVIQLAIGAGIAWRPALKVGLAASVAWSLGVWWLGEGLGGVLDGTADPVTGAPGAVVVYALLAVLLWPADADPAAPFPAGRAIGRNPARLVWLALWGSLAWFAIAPAGHAARDLHDAILQMTSGEPGWLAAAGTGAAALAGRHGLLVPVLAAALLAGIAVCVYGPSPIGRAVLVLAVMVAVVIWIVGEQLGGMLAGMATDPNSGPPLVLLALAYWPRRPARAP